MITGENDYRVQEACGYRWGVRYHFGDSRITVRIRLAPQFSGSTGELERLASQWRDGILRKWSNRFRVESSGSLLTVDVVWVETNEHYTVQVHSAEEYRQSDILNWDTRDTGNDISHEFGHMLGLFDEYPDSRNCASRSPVRTGSVMDVNSGDASQRLIDDVVRRSPSGDGLRRGGLHLADLDGPIRSATLRVAGGRPGHRLDTQVRIDGIRQQTLVTVSDEATGAAASVAEPRSVDVLTTLGRLSEAARDVERLSEADILPHSLIGQITLRTDSTERTVVYPVERVRGLNRRVEGPASPLFSLGTIAAPTGTGQLGEVHRTIMTEARTALTGR